MASYYVYSGAVGAANGTTWADAYTTLATAVSGKATGDIFYIAHDHNESTAGAVTIAVPSALGQFLCVNRAGSVPPVAADLTTGAQIKTTGNNSISISGTLRSYWYGVTFNAGSDVTAGTASIAASTNGRNERCHFRLGGVGTGSRITLVGRAENCTFEFGHASQFIIGNSWKWTNTASAIVGATIPSTLLTQGGNGLLSVEGVDLSAVPSGKAIFVTATGNLPSTLKDCKLASGVTIIAAQNNYTSSAIDVVRCDSGATNYRHERYHGVGTQTTETTIVRTGGASDGVTPISWKIVTAASATVALPFESMPISVWNENTGGTKTITVEGIWGGGAVPDNNDLWIEVEYLGSASDPKGSFVSSGVATILTTPSSYASSSETWGGSTTKFKMSVTTGTINQKGPITVRVFAGLPSSTFYVCPKVAVS